MISHCADPSAACVSPSIQVGGPDWETAFLSAYCPPLGVGGLPLCGLRMILATSHSGAMMHHMSATNGMINWSNLSLMTDFPFRTVMKYSVHPFYTAGAKTNPLTDLALPTNEHAGSILRRGSDHGKMGSRRSSSWVLYMQRWRWRGVDSLRIESRWIVIWGLCWLPEIGNSVSQTQGCSLNRRSLMQLVGRNSSLC